MSSDKREAQKKNREKEGWNAHENKKGLKQKLQVFLLVGVTGLEPAAFWPPVKRATKLRHTPATEDIISL